MTDRTGRRAGPEPVRGRRATRPCGTRLLLDPSPAEFAGFFAGTHGAAFIAIRRHVAFGAHPDGSIDHGTIADAFSPDGAERFRGYARLPDGDIPGSAQIEAWTGAWDAADVDDAEAARIDAAAADAMTDRILGRINGTRSLVVFSTEHGQAVAEVELDPADPAPRDWRRERPPTPPDEFGETARAA